MARVPGAPPSYVLVDAAFATSHSALAPEKPWDHRLTEEDALCILLGHQRGVIKPKQRQALDAWQQGRDAVVLLPTGGGKSATFLLNALRSAGGGLVVEPLRALMRSMVEHVLPEGVGSAATFPSAVGRTHALRKSGSSIVAIDEAHKAHLPEALNPSECRALAASPAWVRGAARRPSCWRRP